MEHVDSEQLKCVQAEEVSGYIKGASVGELEALSAQRYSIPRDLWQLK
jgi:hypothetical protein